jgi:hypothetical protein
LTLTIEMVLLHPHDIFLKAMNLEALAEMPLREEDQRAGDAHRSIAFPAELYLGTLGPKCLLSHGGRRVAKEGY